LFDFLLLRGIINIQNAIVFTYKKQGKLSPMAEEFYKGKQKRRFYKARILAEIGLHVNTPKPRADTITSVFFLQKWNDNPALRPLNPYQEGYSIFMAVSKKPGKNNSGEYVYKRDEKGQLLKNQDGNLIVDHELNKIAEAFAKFAKEQRFTFWK
jgi:type I restriction enzyme M protein